MPRRKKFVLVSAVLLAGVGAGFLFRKDKAPDDASSESSQVTGASASTSPSSSVAAAVPRLLDNVESAEQGSKGDRVSAPRGSERPSPAHIVPDIDTSNPRGAKSDSAPLDKDSASLDSAPLDDGKKSSPDTFANTSIEDEPLDSDTPHGNNQSVSKALPRAAENPAPDSSTSTRRHKIRDGDTLPALAEHFLGDRKRDQEIFEANRDVLAHPDLLPIGAELRIPPRDGHRLALEDQGPSDMVPLERTGNAPGGS